MSDEGMEHRWRVPYIQFWPTVHRDYYETSAEGAHDAQRKVAALLNKQHARPSDWRFDGDPELIL